MTARIAVDILLMNIADYAKSMILTILTITAFAVNSVTILTGAAALHGRVKL